MKNPFSRLSLQEKLKFIEAWKRGDERAIKFFDNYLRKCKLDSQGDGKGILRHKSTMSPIEDWIRREECKKVDGNPWNPDYAKFAHRNLKDRGLTTNV